MLAELETMREIARLAAIEILDVYRGEIAVTDKADSSPLTEADRRANAVITRELHRHWPEVPILSEECCEIPYAERADWREYWLVDPLDGTKEFIKRNGEFTVNIALIRRGSPVAGVVHQPTTDQTYCGAEGVESFRVGNAGARELLGGGRHYSTYDEIRVIASRSHMSSEVKEFVAGLEADGKLVRLVNAGSSLKFCLVADGLADVYPRLGPTMEWDTAAAQCVANGAGRQTLAWKTRQPLDYNKRDLLNPWFIVE
jgi:3'(2'), 5'-bisphosphate nucleotidase